MSNVVDEIYWSALKMDKPGDPNAKYTDLGGNSIGIFKITTEVEKSTGVTIDPVILLSPDGTLSHLKKVISESMEKENA